jgi:hypothetical protein
MKIIELFDLTKSVRESKLAYAFLAESLNFGTQVAKLRNSKQVVKSGSNNKGLVRQIAEGFASKPVSSTKPGIITEATDVMALRFQKLAGIKKQPKTDTSK